MEPSKLNTLDGEVTFDEAIQEEHNMLERVTYWKKKLDFLSYLHQQRDKIEALVSTHLGLKSSEDCQLTQPVDWMHGSFNICLPVNISGWSKHLGRRVLVRFPLPYKIGEIEHPGNADEKLRCEAATYIWIRENCPDVPIPRLWGFAFSGGHSFTTPEAVPFYIRWMRYLQRRLLSLLGYPIPCQYIRSRSQFGLKTGYLVIDYIEEKEGRMLSETWGEFQHDKTRRNNLFAGFSRIILSLGRIPLSRIGSFTINNEGVLSLTNRPLNLLLQQLENERIRTNIDRDLTYATVEPYILDLLALHDSRLRDQPNSVNDASDCRDQMAALTCMRSVLHHFYRRDLRDGPFFFTLTDINQHNVFVDANWNIRYMIDLEWACSLPVEMLHPPYWLTGRNVDQLDGKHLAAFNEIREEFMDAFEREEKLLSSSRQCTSSRTHIMKSGWDTGNFFYFHALNTTVGLCTLFWLHIQPRFARSHALDAAFTRIFAPYWDIEADDFIATKLGERENYQKQLQCAFGVDVDTP